MRRASIAFAALTTLVLMGKAARATNPSLDQCLAASDASLKTNSPRAERIQLSICAARSCPTEVRQECLSRIADVTVQIPTIIFAVKDLSGAALTMVKVTMDSEVLTARLDGKPLAVDPGEHNFLFETTGQPRLTKRLTVREREKDRRELIVLGGPEAVATAAPLPNEALTRTPEAKAALPPSVPSPPVDPGNPKTSDSSYFGTQRVLALVAGGVGVVGLGIGTAFGAMALSKRSEARSACPGTLCTTEAGVNDWSSAGSSGNVSTVGFILGGAGIAGAFTLWFTAPPSSRMAMGPQVGFGPGVIRVKGTW
jgi:hypothetical protein